MHEQHFIFENIAFDYRLMLEDRKTIAATVFPTGAVMVKAPREATGTRIDDFLRRRFRWVLKQQRYFAQFRSDAEKRYVSGERFRYRGRSYKLLLRQDSEEERVSLQHGTLTVYLSRRGDSERVRQLLNVWYANKARSVFAERLATCFNLFGASGEIPRLEVRKQKKRWGSYMRRTHKIILNQELIKASTRHIDYVIMHELCHTVHAKHTRAFYDLLASRLPHWQTLKAELELSLLS